VYKDAPNLGLERSTREPVNSLIHVAKNSYKISVWLGSGYPDEKVTFRCRDHDLEKPCAEREKFVFLEND